jgi:hypothetical protein
VFELKGLRVIGLEVRSWMMEVLISVKIIGVFFNKKDLPNQREKKKKKNSQFTIHLYNPNKDCKINLQPSFFRSLMYLP